MIFKITLYIQTTKCRSVERSQDWLLVTTSVTHPVQDGHQDDGGGDDDEDGDEERRGDQHDRVGEVFWFGPVRSAAEKVGHVKLGGRI